jgi:hypothetical protein
MNRIGIAVLYLAALAGGTYLAFKPTLDSGFARVQTDLGDTVLNHYLLEHSWQVLTNREYRGTLLSPPFFYPTPLVLAYSESLLGVAPVYWALRWVLPDDRYILAYQLWMILLSALNFVAFAAVARWLKCDHLLSILGGFLWAFAAVHLEQLKHQQLIPRFWMPLAVYHGWLFATAPSVRSLGRATACVFLQAITCINSGWFLAVGLATFVPVAAATQPNGLKELVRFARENRRAVVRILGAFFGGLFVFVLPYFVANWGVARSYAESADLMPTMACWVASPYGGRWYFTIEPYRRPVYIEGFLFCGFTLYALMLATAVHAWVRRRDAGRSWELAFAAAALISAGVWWVLTLNVYEGGSAWFVVRFIPGGQSIRCVIRVYLIVYLFANLAVILWLKMLLDRVRRKWVRAAVVLAVAVPLVFEQTGFESDSFAQAQLYPLADATSTGLRGADAGYVLPKFGENVTIQGELLGAWAGLRANVPVVNGYSGRWPPGYPAADIMTDDQLREWLQGRFRGRLAVVDPTRPGEVRYLVFE